MKAGYFFLLLSLSFYAFSPRVIGQKEDSSGVKGTVEALIRCPEQVVPELSQEVVQWLFGRIPYEENMDAAEACLYAHIDRAGIQGAGGRWDIGLCRGALGVIALKRNQPLLAVEHFEAFHQAAVELPDSSSLRAAKHAQICLGRALSAAQQHDEALAHYLSGLDGLWVSDLSECPYLVPAVEDAIALCEQKGYWLKVCQYAEQLILYYRTLTPTVDTAGLIHALVRAGGAHARLGSEAAQSYLNRAQKWMQAFSGPKARYEAMWWLALAYLHSEKEQYSRATLSALYVQKWCEENAGDAALLAEAYLLLATLAQRQGALKLAEESLRRYGLLKELPPLVQARFEVWSLDIKSQLLKAKGDLSGAQAILHNTAFPQPVDSATLEWAGLLTRCAQLYAEASQWDRAEAALQEAIRIIHQNTLSDIHPRIVRLHIMLVDWHLRKGDLDKSKLHIGLAERLLQAPSNQTYPTRLLRVEALEVNARAHLIRYEQEKSAVEELHAATDVLKKAQEQIAELGQQAKTVDQCLYLDQRLRRISELYIKAALLQYECDGDICHLEEAFEVAQRSKDFMSLVLIVSLDRRQEKQKDSLIISATPSQYAVCLEKVAKYQHLIQGDTVNAGDLLQVAGELAEAEKVYRSYLKHFPISNYSPIESERIVRELHKREAVLDYFIGHEALYVFIFQKRKPIQITTVPLSADALVRTIDSLTSAMSGPTARMQLFYKPAYRLYNQLFRPVEDYLRNRVDRIGIIPDQDLFKVSFAALISAEPPVNRADRVAEYPYLMKEYAFYYAYSANHWLISRKAKEPPIRPRVVVLKPNEAKLEGGEEEFRQIRRNKGVIAIGDTISKGQFFDRIKKEHVAYYIGHGRADTGAVLLWKGSGANGPENIYPPDVLERSLSTSLLVLSTCSAAQPSYKQPYALSITKAFSYAGVASVVGADWAVEDRASGIIMVKMYNQLLERRTRSKAHALQSAQQAYLDSTALAHPYYWAGFRIFGNNVRFDHPDRRKIRRATKFIRMLREGQSYRR
jgi:CHAT domain-containing protein